MNWTENRPPSEGHSYYDHCKLTTPLGLFVIEWKGWKDNDGFDVSLQGEWIGVCSSLEAAKEFVKNYLITINQKITEYLS